MSVDSDLLEAIGEDVLSALEGVLEEVKKYLDEHANDRLGIKLAGKVELFLGIVSELEEEEDEEGEDFDDPDDEDDEVDEDDDWEPAPFADAAAAGEEDDDEGDDEEDPV